MSSRSGAWAGVLLVLGHLCWLQLQAGSASRAIWAGAASPTAAPPAKRAEALAPDAAGNVLLQLVGYARTNPVVDVSLFYYYCVNTYSLYPRRLYAAPTADQLIRSGRDIMREGFNPDPRWLDEHQVRYVLAFGDGNVNGEPQFRSRPPGHDAASGTQPKPLKGE